MKLRERDSQLFVAADVKAGTCLCLLARQDKHTKEKKWQLTRECALAVSHDCTVSTNVTALKTLSKLFAMAHTDMRAGERVLLSAGQLDCILSS